MQFSLINISFSAKTLLQDLLQKSGDYAAVNQEIKTVCGIFDFFENREDYDEFRKYLSDKRLIVQEPDRAEYGDFQTNTDLAERIAFFLRKDGACPEVVIEPTFGKGNFILAALKNFPKLKQVRGFEIFKPYVWEAKFNVLNYFLEHPDHSAPEIRLFHQDVFSVDFQKIGRAFVSDEVLILGNPPWVTNAKLGSLESGNLPVKSNFKNHNGFDAMTGKGNFDIGEYITLSLLRAFQNHSGRMAFLVKNSVIKNIVFDQRATKLRIGNMTQCLIDAKKEFSASVEAALFSCKLNQTPDYQCAQIEMAVNAIPRFYFGWKGNRFVANVEKYKSFKAYDGTGPFEWRQGLKHDCSGIMELDRVNGHFSTGLGKIVRLENDLVYGILKSSDLKGGIVSSARKFTIVTQTKIGQDTAYIQKLFPKTYAYLHEHREQFANRKSSIYRGKPPFSIFGIGDYSFLPYKIAISGLYKSPVFTLVLPENGKPLMLDDTCYFIGFEEFSHASIAFALLNHPLTSGLLHAITFADAKRIFTKEVLMRIDLQSVADSVGYDEIVESLLQAKITKLPEESAVSLFRQAMAGSQQLQMF